MKQKTPLRIRFCNFSGTAAAVLAAVAFSFLTLVSLVQTCRVDIGFSAENSEHVSFLWDNIAFNLVLLAALLAATYLLLRAKITKRAAYAAFACVLAASGAIGVWWVLASRAVPGADSARIINGALELLNGNAKALGESAYFHTFPFQLGYLLFAEAVLRAAQSADALVLAFVNVACVELAYIAVFCLAKRLFRDARVWLLTALYLGLCPQPMLLSTFLYGTLPGLAFALWAMYFVIVSVQSGKFWPLVPAAALLAAAVVVKKNYLIVLIACAILLLLQALRKKKAAPALGALVLAALSLAAPVCMQKSYEARLGADFGKGTPQTAWLVTGFSESSFCCGWFNSYTTSVLRENGYDYDKTAAQCREDLAAQLTFFAGRPRYFASFMYQKITSQWNEPAYQCIWSSAAGERSGPVSAFVESLGTGEAGEAVNAYFNQIMQYIYVGFTLFLFRLCKKKGRADELLLPLVILGAAMYHALFEAKAQYAVIYVPMMLPCAACAMTALCDRMALHTGERAAPKPRRR